jgi:hypothetical protein
MRIEVFRSARQARLAASLTAGAAIAIAGCGSSAPATRPAAEHHRAAAPTLCEPQVLDAIAQYLKVPPAKITARQSVGNDAEPQCTFVARVADGRRVAVIANVGVEVGAYFILERTEVEASQMFAPTRLSPAPQAVYRLGLEADWFPAETHLMATDGTRLVTTTVTWGRVSEARRRALATVVTRPYLKTPHGKAAVAKAEGYPSG